MNRIDILTYQWDGDRSEYFNEDILSCSRNSVLINWDLNKAWIRYKPENIKLKKLKVNFFKINNQYWRGILSPLILSVNIIQVFQFFLSICCKYRPKIFIVENYIEGIMAGIIRRFKLAGKTIYIPSDWYTGYNYKNFFSNIVNNTIFPYADYLACRINDIVIDPKGDITECRNKYWGKEITTTKDQFFQQPRIMATNICIDEKRTKICFLGEMREDSGLDIVIKSLGEIRNYLDVTLKISGRKRLHYEYFRELSKQYNVEPYVKFLGFVERKKFNEIFSDCFCGLNILITKNSHTSHVINSKIMYYLQYLLPIVATEGLHKSLLLDIQSNELGIIIQPTHEEFIKAIFKVYSEQVRYRENIVKYIKSFPKTSIKEYIEI